MGGVAGFLVWNLKTIDDSFDEWAASAMNNAALIEVQRDVVQARLAVAKFTLSPEPATLETAVLTARDEALAAFAAVIPKLRSPEHMALVSDSQALAIRYWAEFDRLAPLVKERLRLEFLTLQPAAEALQRSLQRLAEVSGQQGDVRVARVDQTRESFLHAQLAVQQFINRPSETTVDAARERLATVDSALAGIDDGVQSPVWRDELAAARKSLADYRSGLDALATTIDERERLYTEALPALGVEIQAKLDGAQHSSENELEQHLRALEDGNARTMLEALVAVAAGIATGGLLAWLIGRAISGPIGSMAQALRALATGDRTAAIPGLGRQDEIGDMAAAAEVFQRSALAVAQRAETVDALVRAFDSEVGMILRTVSGATTELDATAGSLREAAQQQSSDKASLVASSAGQASANVTTVASAVEELTASIREITQGRRAAHDHAAGGGRGARRQRQVARLVETAEKIGEHRAHDHRHRRPDQPAGAQRHHRGGARRRSRQGLRRGRHRGQEPRQPDRKATEEIAARSAASRRPRGEVDRCHPRHAARSSSDERDRHRDRCRRRGAGCGHPRDRSQRAGGRARHGRGLVEHRHGERGCECHRCGREPAVCGFERARAAVGAAYRESGAVPGRHPCRLGPRARRLGPRAAGLSVPACHPPGG